LTKDVQLTRKLDNDTHKLDGSAMRESSKPSSPLALNPKPLKLDKQIWLKKRLIMNGYQYNMVIMIENIRQYEYGQLMNKVQTPNVS
jgi:hypothetical protein